VSSGDGDGFGTAFDFLRALWELNHALESSSRFMKKRLGVTGPERFFIRVVGQRPGVTPREIARTLRVHPSSITPLVKKLERRGLVARRAHATDGRSYTLHLTVRGERVNALRSGTIEAAVRKAIASSDPDDVATTAAMLVRVAQDLAATSAGVVSR
jgi:DNA-binding MarR family transcriptional regulator